jgi:hypothetical protein
MVRRLETFDSLHSAPKPRWQRIEVTYPVIEPELVYPLHTPLETVSMPMIQGSEKQSLKITMP